MATVFNFAQAKELILEFLFFFKINVIGPGTKLFIQFFEIIINYNII